MKCPFLIVRKDMYDDNGKKIGEDIEIKECIKNDCMVYDGATKLCSLLASNMKTGVLIDDVKSSLKTVRNQVDKQTKAFSELLSTNLQALQDALIGRLDILKKQNEVIVLGFDRIVETINGKFEMLKRDFAENLGALKQAVSDSSAAGVESLNAAINRQIAATQDALSKLNQLDALVAGLTSVNDLVRSEIAGLKSESLEALGGMSAKFDELGIALADAAGLQQQHLKGLLSSFSDIGEGMSTKFDEIRTALADAAGLQQQHLKGLLSSFSDIGEGMSTKLDEIRTALADAAGLQQQHLKDLVSGFSDIGGGIRAEVTDMRTHSSATFEGFRNDVGTHFNEIKSEIAGLKDGQAVGLNNVQVAFSKLEDLFKQSSDNLGTMSTMMRDLNNNYVESLGRIAGLAEGMRKGVEQVGEGVHDSVQGLISEMKSEIGALENQYEKAFADIANLAGKFADLNTRIGNMTTEIQSEFKDSFGRQEKLSEYTQTILQHIKDYFDRQDVRYQEEQEQSRKKEGLDHFDRATLYYYRGTYELALNEIEKALEIEKTAEYLNLKGLLLTELGKFDESKETYKEAMKIEPDFAEIHNNLGLLYLKMKKLDDAVVSFQKAVKKNVNYARAYVNLGKALIDLENFDEALKAFERALEIDPANREADEAIRLYKEGKIGS